MTQPLFNMAYLLRLLVCFSMSILCLLGQEHAFMTSIHVFAWLIVAMFSGYVWRDEYGATCLVLLK